MEAISQISIGDYLETSYRPDREYIDGEIRERNVGIWEHARIQALLANWFINHEKEWKTLCSVEQRTLVGENRVRVPDVVVLAVGPQPDVISNPPLLVVEILSPDDSYSDTQERAQDYRKMGVQTVWIIDPKTRSGRACSGLEWKEARRLEVEGASIYVDLDDIFRQI